MNVLSIDPGNEESGIVVIDSWTYRPVEFGKIPNEQVERYLSAADPWGAAVVEMVASYGMPVGATVFETCVAIGRFEKILDLRGIRHERLFRREVKRHVCGVVSAKDSNVKAAMIERFAPTTPNGGKGYKKAPGWFYGFKADVWQAYALGVTWIDIQKEQCQQRDI